MIPIKGELYSSLLWGDTSLIEKRYQVNYTISSDIKLTSSGRLYKDVKARKGKTGK